MKPPVADATTAPARGSAANCPETSAVRSAVQFFIRQRHFRRRRNAGDHVSPCSQGGDECNRERLARPQDRREVPFHPAMELDQAPLISKEVATGRLPLEGNCGNHLSNLVEEPV